MIEMTICATVNAIMAARYVSGDKKTPPLSRRVIDTWRCEHRSIWTAARDYAAVSGVQIYFIFENICASLLACISIEKLGMLSKPRPRGGPSSLSGSMAL